MAQANEGHAPAYGEDAWTARAADLIREIFETNCEVFFAFNGTAANSLALASMCQSYHSILCHEISHIETDECGAPEFFSNGTKLLPLAGEAGKLHGPLVGVHLDVQGAHRRVLDELGLHLGGDRRVVDARSRGLLAEVGAPDCKGDAEHGRYEQAGQVSHAFPFRTDGCGRTPDARPRVPTPTG